MNYLHIRLLSALTLKRLQRCYGVRSHCVVFDVCLFLPPSLVLGKPSTHVYERAVPLSTEEQGENYPVSGYV